MQVTKDELQIIRAILSGLDATAVIFGSRVKNSARKDSDLDICLKGSHGPVGLAQIGDLRARLAESSLPYVVDVVDYESLPESFREVVDREGRAIYPQPD